MNLKTYSHRFDPSLLAVAIVTVLSNQVVTKPWEFVDDQGKTRTGATRTQKAKLEVQGFAYPFVIRLEEEQAAWPVGEYVLDVAAMLQVNKEKAQLSKAHYLVPLLPATAKA
ncbi:single-stranded DNA-binding protein [Lysobacter sp. A6]|uniref:Single-stranded DNA-binding protein n=1 Tax=Noviluteimonas lactosilytica TaxID=2888523 RepID=A0ABS8JI20_9GAMM|nr:single-stranded DNA-binding protein [Lysobacter lactosilyticus]MCC8363258.1 single-stranded DNA-binding protein [Lysobacter lactosilyticus]